MSPAALTRLSVDTFVETASLFAGVALEDRAHVRDRQDLSLLAACARDGLALPPARPGERSRYYYGCLDFLPFRAEDGREGFQLLEFNGTGMGGLSNLPWPVLEELLGELSRVPAALGHANPLIVMPLSIETKPGLVHERVLVAQALREGLRRSLGAGRLWLLRDAPVSEAPHAPHGPAVALGYPRVVKGALAARDGRLTLGGRAVDVAVRDLFCQHVSDRYAGELAPDAFYPVNALFPLCASKARTYALYNGFLAGASNELLRRPVAYWPARTREELVAVALDARARGVSLVVKPHASGAGRGVEFLPASLGTDEVLARIAAAIADAERASLDGLPRKAFPYVACELLDGLTLRDPGHVLHGHRYELRIVVYRSGGLLHVFPAACKVASARFDPDAPARAMLLNTVSVSGGAAAGGGQLLPLCNARTLDAIGLTVEALGALCDFSLRFVAHAIAAP